jgi:two-component system, LytTR family, sensor kinase
MSKLSNVKSSPFYWPLVGLIFYSLLVGSNAIVYFVFQIFKGGDKEIVQALGVLLNNISILFSCLPSVAIILRYRRFFAQKWQLHLALSVVMMFFATGISFLTGFLWRQVLPEVSGGQFDWLDLVFMVTPLILVNLFYYWLTRERDRSLKISEQEYELIQLQDLKMKAELAALQAKINPHFLYNSLNSIASLVHENPERAEDMVINLSKFYRYSTGRSEDYFDTLSNEIEMIKTYLAIEQVRFGDRLQYVIDILPALSEIKIPRFLIQPLVENSIKHGIAQVPDKGLIQISVAMQDDWIELNVHDNGPAFPDHVAAGYGLKSISDKLRLLCGNSASILLLNEPQKIVKLRWKK